MATDTECEITWNRRGDWDDGSEPITLDVHPNATMATYFQKYCEERGMEFSTDAGSLASCVH